MDRQTVAMVAGTAFVVMCILVASSFIRETVLANNTLSQSDSIVAAEGWVTLLRAHDVGTGFGPPADFIDIEVVIQLDSQPGKAFGFQLRDDGNEAAQRGMLDVLRDAFSHNDRVRIDYVDTGSQNGHIIRVMSLPTAHVYLPFIAR